MWETRWFNFKSAVEKHLTMYNVFFKKKTFVFLSLVEIFVKRRFNEDSDQHVEKEGERTRL